MEEEVLEIRLAAVEAHGESLAVMKEAVQEVARSLDDELRQDVQTEQRALPLSLSLIGSSGSRGDVAMAVEQKVAIKRSMASFGPSGSRGRHMWGVKQSSMSKIPVCWWRDRVSCHWWNPASSGIR